MSFLDRIANRLGYVPGWTVPPPRPPMKPDGKTSEQVFEALDNWWSKSKRVEIMDEDTTGPDNRYLMVTLRFTAPRPGSHGEEMVRQRAADTGPGQIVTHP